MTLTPGDTVAVAYLVIGVIGPAYEPGSELNVGSATVSQALMESTGASRSDLSKHYR